MLPEIKEKFFDCLTLKDKGAAIIRNSTDHFPTDAQ